MVKSLGTFSNIQAILEHLEQSSKDSAIVAGVPLTNMEYIQAGDPASDYPVADYAEAMRRGDDFPPMEAVITKNGEILIWDGNTRGKAAQAAGLGTFAVRFSIGTRVDAIMKAAGANETNGRRRTNNDKHSAARLVVTTAELAAFSNNRLAKIARVSPQIIEAVREELDAEAVAEGRAPFSPEQRTVRRGSQEYTAKAKRNPAKRKSDPLQRLVDQVLMAAKNFDIGQRAQLAEKLAAALGASPDV